ncbi:MAG: hypothetical protein COX57_10340 [Alphaproteobacteria bacterium CG_4_10_14_0_2_um_filter_63_37]|nr:MAG: hypothetical protein AUJ55_00600 [Proteobacteria bacterium CG1_02_64_396]PJA23981.1 MAG: hypothetical protein COX57_10340 [Alphaproteobacteria bacterium CG_4_10_14_0_2_um_filter_63_37]
MEKRLLAAFALSLLVMVGFQFMFTPTPPLPGSEDQTAQVEQQTQEGGGAAVSDAAVTALPGDDTEGATPQVGRGVGSEAGAQGSTTSAAQPEIDLSGAVVLHNQLLQLTVLPVGGRIVDAAFLKYPVAPGSEERVHLLQADAEKRALIREWFDGDQTQALPLPTTPFAVTAQSDQSLTLTWSNQEGVTFTRTITIDSDKPYLVHSNWTVSNAAAVEGVRYHCDLVAVPFVKESNMVNFYDHAGPQGYIGGQWMQVEYDEVGEKLFQLPGTQGWIGQTIPYFLAAVMAPTDRESIGYLGQEGRMVVTGLAYPTGGASWSQDLFIGPKEVDLMEEVGRDLPRAIDFGWITFLGRPLLDLLVFFEGYLGNWGLAIIMLTLAIKIVLFPLANASYKSLNGMRKLTPKLQELKEKYKDDRQKQSQEMMALYQKHKINPMGGCLPILIQIPIFFALYRVFASAVELRMAPFYGWITDMTAQDPYYILPVLFGISMFIQQKLNPAPADKMQERILLLLPVIFTFFFMTFPSGLVLYWLVNNVLSIAQQAYIYKKFSDPLPEKVRKK